MIIINVLKEKNLEQLRERQQFVKPSVVKRSEKLKAIYKQHKNNPED
jgi:ribosomal protein S21